MQVLKPAGSCYNMVDCNRESDGSLCGASGSPVYENKIRRDDGTDMEKTVSESRIEQVYQVRPEHLNGAGRMFGGKLMEWIDELAGFVAIRHSQQNVITASVDNLRFIRGAYLGDLVVLIGKITFVGRTSMEVRVDTYVETMDGIRKPINRAYLTLVAVDGEGKPVEVPGLTVQTESEKAEWDAGIRRRKMRMQRRTEGF